MTTTFYDLMPKTVTVRDDIQLRLIVPEDAQRIFEIFQADPDIQNKVTWTFGLKTYDDIRRKVENFHDKNELRYAILFNGDLVGYIGCWKDDGWFGVVHQDDYGYGYFCDPAVRGKGIITDAAKTLMSAVESIADVKTFSLYIEDVNLASQAVAKKLGFARTDETYLEPVLGTIERRYIRTIIPTQ